jgi:hypothetical protein
MGVQNLVVGRIAHPPVGGLFWLNQVLSVVDSDDDARGWRGPIDFEWIASRSTHGCVARRACACRKSFLVESWNERDGFRR